MQSTFSSFFNDKPRVQSMLILLVEEITIKNMKGEFIVVLDLLTVYYFLDIGYPALYSCFTLLINYFF